jgi:enoyl-CoA hydratase/carnithine racemase
MTLPDSGCEFVSYELHERGRVALIALRRPEKRNAITGAMAAALERCIGTSERDARVRAVVLTGGPRAFCAGADLREVAAGRGKMLRTPQGGFAGLVDAERRKPLIAAVGGPALAGGFEIVLACDMVIAASNALFGLPEVSRGLVASGAGVYRLPRAIPRHIALDLIATGRTIDAARAHALGLVSEVVEPERLLSAALDLARTVAANSPLAVRESLALARASASTGDEDIRRAVRAAGDRMLVSEDAREGARAFLERRAPVWPDDSQ